MRIHACIYDVAGVRASAHLASGFITYLQCSNNNTQLTLSVDLFCRLLKSMEFPPELDQIMEVRMWAYGDSWRQCEVPTGDHILQGAVSTTTELRGYGGMCILQFQAPFVSVFHSTWRNRIFCTQTMTLISFVYTMSFERKPVKRYEHTKST